MPRKDRADKLLDAPTEVLLVEHERLSALYLYNAEMGEKRISAYLTIVSIAIGAVFGLTQLRDMDTLTLIELCMGILLGISLLGILTFVRLVERRARAAEYLRAINRIHAYFVRDEPRLMQHFAWPPCDDVPSFGGRRYAGGLKFFTSFFANRMTSDFAALRDVISILNSLFIGILLALGVYLMWGETNIVLLILLGVVVAIVLLAGQQWFEDFELRRAEEGASKDVRFPQADLHLYKRRRYVRSKSGVRRLVSRPE